MARPIKDGMDYFPHDTSMSSDDRMEMVEHRFGNDGYAIYCKILEKVYQSNGKFHIKTDEHLKLYGDKWHIGSDKLKEIIEYFCELNLFPRENFISNSVKKRLKKINTERRRKRNYQKNKEDKGIVMDVHNPAKTSELPPKEKERKGKERKVNNIKNIATPLHNLCKEIFITEYHRIKGTEYYWDGKNAGQLNSLIGKIKSGYVKKHGQDPTDEQIGNALKLILQNLNDKFVKENLTVALLNSNLSTVIAKIKSNNIGNTNKTEYQQFADRVRASTDT